MSEDGDNAYLDRLADLPGEELIGKGTLLGIALRQRTEIASLRERVRVLEQTLTTVEARCDYMTENDLQPTSADLSDISSLCHAAANEPIEKETQT